MEEKKNIFQNKKLLLIIPVLLVVAVIGVTYAFFNYTRTGETNTVGIGRIAFNTDENGTHLQLTNVFPMTASQANINALDQLSVRITGDTTYAEGEEFEITMVNVANAINGKEIPISYVATYTATTNETIGSESATYYTSRNGSNSAIYTLQASGEVKEGKQVLVGFIPAGDDGIDGTLTIKAYLDSSKVIISDTLENGAVEATGYVNGTPDGDYTVLTTAEWNALQGNSTLSFNIRAISNEGIWVVKQPEKAHKVMRSVIATKSNVTTEADAEGVVYLKGTEETIDFNYVWYSGKLWRIVGIYPDGKMKLVTENPMTAIYWGATQNDVAFNNSYVDQWLREEFLPTLYNYSNLIVTNAEWNVTTTTATTDPYQLDNSTKINKTVGLLNAYEYTQTKPTSGSSYLHIGQYWWLMNPYSTSFVRYVNGSGSVNNIDPSSDANAVRPSIILQSSVRFQDGGDGTRSNPYRIFNDKDTGSANDPINERLSGEYVSINGELYRIFGFENNTTKIVKAGYITNPNSSNTSDQRLGNFGSDVYYNTQSDDLKYWDKYLTDNESGWLATGTNVPSTSLLVSGTYYQGVYANAANYKTTICTSNDATSTNSCTKISGDNTSYTGLVGLLRVGEMHAAQQATTTHINSSSSYKAMWLISPYSTSHVRAVILSGSVGNGNPSSLARAVRPALYLASGVKILSGNGTVYSPYVVG